MTTTNFGSRRRATSSTAPATKSRIRSKNNGIVEDIFVPFKVIYAEDGGATKHSDRTTYFELEHLVSGAKIKTVVFGDDLPNSVESKILDCILPDDTTSYDPEDLVGGGFEALLKFNTKNEMTYINIKDVKPLQVQHQKLVQQAIQKAQLANQQIKDATIEVEKEMGSNGLLDDEAPSNNSPKPMANISGNQRAAEESFDEDEELDLDLDIEDDVLDDESDLIVGDSDCPFCDDLGCEACEDDEE